MAKQFSGYLEPEEVHEVLEAIKYVSKHPDRDRLLVEIMWQGGARVGEAVRLKPEHIGPTSLILLNEKQYKTKRVAGKTKRYHDPTATKEVEVSRALCDALKRYCKLNNLREGSWIFPANPRARKSPCLARKYVWRLMDRASRLALIFRFGKKHPKTGGRFKGASPHMLRHSNGMYLLDQTGNIALVQANMGHASITSTQIYAHAKERKVKKEISKIEW